MSQLPKAKGGKPSKRKAGAAAAQTQTNSLATDDRTVRQRTDQSASVGSKGGPAAAAGSFVPAALSPLMRLAVVERQLIMQLLNIESLARFSSTCKQMRVEAMHKEAGKFIPVPAWNTREGDRRSIEIELDPDVKESRPAHLSPLFRKHMPMLLCLAIPEAGEALELRMVEPLLRKADNFSRITEITVPGEVGEGNVIWPEKRILAFLNRPCIQRVERIHLGADSWLKHPKVQSALFALPCLAKIELPERLEGTPLIKSALAQAHALRSITLSVMPEEAKSIRVLRSAPGLTSLILSPMDPGKADGAPFAHVVWCLPSTLETLSLRQFDVREAAASRSLLKAMFQRLPELQTFRARVMQPAPLLQGLLDAGVQSLPKLRRVELGWLHELDPALLRRFLHRFPAVHVQLELAYGEDKKDSGIAFARRFGGWPRVQVIPTPAENDGPPAADKADDVDGPSIEAAVDPGSDDEK